MKKILSMILITGMIVGLISGCGKEVVKEKEESVEETEENISEEADDTDKTEETEAITQLVYFTDYYMENYGEDIHELPKVGEQGNTYGFDESLLGYYSNGIVGLNFRQINGGMIDIDLFLWDYFFGSYWVDVLEPNQFTFRMDAINEAGSYNDYNIPIEGDSFTITHRDKAGGNWVSMVVGQQVIPSLINMAMTYIDIDDYDSILDNLIVGKYTKQEDDKIDSLMVVNNFVSNPVSDEQLGENMTGNMYYQNTQPATDRLSKDSYPKYIHPKNMPQSDCYILGDPTDKSGVVVEANVITSEDGIPEMNTSIGVKISLYTWFETTPSAEASGENSRWIKTSIGTIRFVSFNYEVDGLIGTSKLGFAENYVEDTKSHASELFYSLETLSNSDYEIQDNTFIMYYDKENDEIYFDAPVILKDVYKSIDNDFSFSITIDDRFRPINTDWKTEYGIITE